jgi:hypothetical protein
MVAREAEEFLRLHGLGARHHLLGVLVGCAAGLTRKEMAVSLGLSRDTVRSYEQELHAELGVHSRGEMVALLLAAFLGARREALSS